MTKISVDVQRRMGNLKLAQRKLFMSHSLIPQKRPASVPRSSWTHYLTAKSAIEMAMGNVAAAIQLLDGPSKKYVR